MMEGMVPVTVWITGLSASGKTTLGRGLYERLKSGGLDNVDLHDGEDVRRQLYEIYGYGNRDRDALNMYKCDLAANSNRAGRIAIVTSVSHRTEVRKRIRRRIGGFMEVYLRCSPGICAERDYKGHYSKAAKGEYDNFVGVTEPYQEYDEAELELNTADMSVEECLDILYREVAERAGLGKGTRRDLSVAEEAG